MRNGDISTTTSVELLEPPVTKPILAMALEVGAEVLERKVALRERGNLGSPRRTGQLSLEGEPQPEFDLPGCTQRVDACSYPNAVDIMAGGSSSIDLSGCSRQQSVQRGPR
jgi:hypothetical protein